MLLSQLIELGQCGLHLVKINQSARIAKTQVRQSIASHVLRNHGLYFTGHHTQKAHGQHDGPRGFSVSGMTRASCLCGGLNFTGIAFHAANGGPSGGCSFGVLNGCAQRLLDHFGR